MVIEKSGGNNFWRYVPKDFAEKGILGISQKACALEPSKCWTRFWPSHFSPCSYPPEILAPSSPGVWLKNIKNPSEGKSLKKRYFNFGENPVFTCGEAKQVNNSLFIISSFSESSKKSQKEQDMHLNSCTML